MPGLLQRLTGLLRGFRDLAALLTAAPLGGGSLEGAARHFYMVPVVGLLEGLGAAFVLALSHELGFTPLLAGSLYVAYHVAVTGGLHLDGLADYADVIGSRSSGSRAVEVAKDPRSGPFATIAVALAMLLSAAATAEIYKTLSLGGILGVQGLASTMASVYAASASAMYVTLALGPREPYRGMASMFGYYARRYSARFAAACLTLLLAVALVSLAGHEIVGLWASLVVWAIGLAVGVAVARDSESRIGFVNGDVAGFSFEASRVLGLLASAAVVGLA